MNVTERRLSRILDRRIPYAYLIETSPEDVHPDEAEESLGIVRECNARTVAVNIDGKICIAVIPAAKEIDLDRLRRYLGAEKVRFATDEEYKALFHNGVRGAIPLIGSKSGVRVLIAHELMDYQEIDFIVGAPQVIVHIRLSDFLVREKPYVCARNAILRAPAGGGTHCVTVYRLDERTLEKAAVGMLVERRKMERGNNAVGLLRLARKEFTEALSDHSRIVIEDGDGS